MLTQEQADNIKEQLFKQIENFPEDQRENMKKQINEMSLEELEEFLKQNGLIGSQDSQAPQQQCIFCVITEGKIPSYKIAENSENLAILEINPLSKGHSIIVPKKHLSAEEVPDSAFNLAKKVYKKIKQSYYPKDIEISLKKIMGHSLIEVLPIFGDEKERKKLTNDELTKLKSELEIISEQLPQPVQKPQVKQQPIKLPLRIP